MLPTQRIGLLYSSLSFLAAFFFTNGIFERICDREEYSEESLEYLSESRQIDTVQISRSRPRDEFVFTIEPWKVQKRMEGKAFDCPRTSKTDLIKMVVFVKSAANYTARRDSVRNTWGSVSHLENMIVHIVFVIGMTTTDIQRGIKGEDSYHGDILQFIGVDDYRHIAYKVLAGMQWAKDNLPKDYYYATADDDLLVNMTDIPKQLRQRLTLIRNELSPTVPKTFENIISHMPIICLLSYILNEPPIRTVQGSLAKYHMNVREYPMRVLPPFCLGGFYMMPKERVGELYDTSRFEKALPMDDVWITGVIRHKILTRHIDAMDQSVASHQSNYIKHLRGDVEGNEVVVQTRVLNTWAKIYESIKKKRHCLRDEFGT